MYICASVKDVLDESSEDRISLASSTADPRILLTLASDPNRVVRGVAAKNPCMPYEGLKKLARDPDGYVRNMVLNIPNMLPELYELAADATPSGIVTFNFIFSIDDAETPETVREYLEPWLKEHIIAKGYTYLDWVIYTDEPYLDTYEIELVVTCGDIFGRDNVHDFTVALADLIDQAGYVVEESDYNILLEE